MSTVIRMQEGISGENPPREPSDALGVRRVKEVIDYIRDLHDALQEAVEKEYGGYEALATAIGKSRPDTSLKVRRAENSKGEIQRANLDLVGNVVIDDKARHRFIRRLLDRWGYKPPEFKEEPTVEKKLSALLATLHGEAGEAIKERAADNHGFDVGAFDR